MSRPSSLRLLDDAALPAGLRTEAHATTSSLSGDRIARETIELYKLIANRRGRP